MKILILIMLILTTFRAFALEHGCSLQPKEINNLGTKLVEKIQQKKKSLPEIIPLQTDIEAEFNSIGGDKFYGTIEGFFRPSEDDFVSLTPLPVLGFDVSKERIVVYACAHFDPNPKKTHLTLYFLRGYHMDPATFSNFFGDLINKPHMKIRPVPASLLGIGVIKKFFLRIFRFIPFSSIYFDTWSYLQRFLANALGDITGFGVERIEITEEYFKVSSGVNLDSPRESLYKKTFKLKKPELGPGIENQNTQSRTFMLENDQEVLQNLEKNNATFEEVEEQP